MSEFNIWHFIFGFIFAAMIPYILYGLLEALAENFFIIFGGLALIIIIAFIIAIPAYRDYTIRQQVSSGISLTFDVKSKVENYYSKNKEIPNNNLLIDIGKIPVSNEYVSNLSISNGNTIEIEFGKKANEKILGKKIIYKANVEKNSFSWSCTTNIEEIDKYFLENVRGLCHFSKL